MKTYSISEELVRKLFKSVTVRPHAEKITMLAQFYDDVAEDNLIELLKLYNPKGYQWWIPRIRSDFSDLRSGRVVGIGNLSSENGLIFFKVTHWDYFDRFRQQYIQDGNSGTKVYPI